MSKWPTVEVKLITEGAEFSARSIGMYWTRRDAAREAKRAAGWKPLLIQIGNQMGYKGENGTAWIIE